jgi:protein TonB
LLLASTAFHAVLLGFAIKPVSQARFSSAPRAVEEVHYLSLSLGENRRERAGRPHRASRGTLHPPRFVAVDLTSALTLVSAPSIPTPTFPLIADSLWGDPLGESTLGLPGRSSRGAAEGDGVGSDSVAYIAATVEKEAAGLGDNPKPTYPSDLLNRLIEARFSVFFVVDTSGRIDPRTIEVPPSVHEGFAKAVLDVLVRWHFYPAEVRGRRVRQLMEQPFEFRIVGPGFARSAAM